MSTPVPGDYLKVGPFKSAIGIEDDQDDSEIQDTVKSINWEIETAITPAADSLPLTGKFLESAKQIALHKGKAWWKAKLGNKELADFHTKQGEKRLEELKDALKSVPQDRTKRFLAGDDPRKKKLPLPSQRDTFILDNF